MRRERKREKIGERVKEAYSIVLMQMHANALGGEAKPCWEGERERGRMKGGGER